jgi:hypothetical protein
MEEKVEGVIVEIWTRKKNEIILDLSDDQKCP